MARLGSSPLAYGHNHHDEHVAAARKGWLRRRLGTSFAGSNEHRWISRAVGPVEHAHEHPDHRGLVAFKQQGKWYELPRREFRELVAAGREEERREQAEKKAAAHEARWQAQFEKLEADDAKREAKKAATAARQQERHERQQRALVRSVARAERAEVVKLLKELGGVRVERSRVTGKARDRGEVALLPADVRRKDGRITLDGAREAISTHMPWLNIDTPNDVVQFFEKARVKTMREKYDARYR